MSRLHQHPESHLVARIFAAIGAALAAYFFWSIYTYPYAAIIRGGHIAYIGEPPAPVAIGILYRVGRTMVRPISPVRRSNVGAGTPVSHAYATCITLGLTIAEALEENTISVQRLSLADGGDSNFLRGATILRLQGLIVPKPGEIAH